MFYCSEILNQRRGQFAIIWLAATRGRKLTRRDFNSVNIVKTCDAIITYLFATSRKKRLSLYLSTQLMYGTLLIYKKQQDLLLDDVSNLMTRFHKSISKEVEINLKMIIKKEQVTKATFLSEMEPGFGELAESDIPSVSEIPDVDVWKSVISPEIPRVPSALSPTMSKTMTSLPPSPTVEALAKYKPEYSPHTVPSTNITLQEIPIEKPIQPTEQPELPALEYQDLKMIAEQPVEIEIQQQQLPKTPEKSPPRVPVQETPKDALPDQVTPVAPDRRKHKAVDPNVTQEHPSVSKRKRPRIPPMILSPVVSVSGRPRKRRLMVDLETSLSRDTIRKNLTTTSNIVRDIMENRVSHDIKFKSTVKELFKRPVRKEFNHKHFYPLWIRNLKAVTEFSETESERKQPIFSVPELRLSSTSGSSVSSEKSQERPRRKPTPPTEEILPTETVRRGESIASDRAMTPVSVKLGKSADSIHGSISLEESLRKRRKTDSQSLSEEEITHIEDTLSRRLEDELYPLPEEVPMDFAKVSLSPVKHFTEMLPTSEFSVIHLLEAVEKHTLAQDWTTFKEICPLYTPRNRAAVVFYTLLIARKEKYVSIKQDEPFGDIFIRLRHTYSS